MNTHNEDSSFLYFVVGMLVISVTVLGLFYMYDSDISRPGYAPAMMERSDDRGVPTMDTAQPSYFYKVDERKGAKRSAPASE